MTSRLLFAAFFAAAALNGQTAADLLNRGAALHSEGKPQEAIAPLQQALKLDPKIVRAQDTLAASLAESGRCQEAIPGLLRAVPRASSTGFRRVLELDGLRCTMTTGSPDVFGFLQLLSRDFPNDAEVLYLLTHAYSDLSMRTSQQLIARAPESAHVHLLSAESLEVQGQWDEAAAEYRKVLETNPRLRGMHYRLGRLLMSKPKTADSAAEARREFEAELKVNPDHPGAEFVLGEMARQDGKYTEAAAHFSRAAALDPAFAEAHFALGRTYMENGQFAEAIVPLQKVEKMQPDNPEVHYRLASAYRQTGRADDATREAALHKQTSERANVAKQTLQKKLDRIPEN